jgi:flavin-dependent dehydrogenase
MRPDWDAVVVGAGPAGAVAALELARRGLSVLLAERKPFPRAKVCGGCLNARGAAALERLGLGPMLQELASPRLNALALSARGRQVSLPLSGGLAVDRAQLDERLVDEAVVAGASFAPESQVMAGPVEPHLRRLRLRSGGSESETSAAIVIAADGLGSTWLGGDASAQSRSRLGAGTQVRSPGPEYAPGRIHMGVGTGGYVGLVRLGDGRLNVAAAFDPDLLRSSGGLAQAARSVLVSAGLPALPELDGAHWTGTPALTRRPAAPAAERLFAVGDASGYVEPFTGEGMAWALADAIAVAAPAEVAAVEWRPSLAAAWTRRHRERTRAARWRCSVIAGLLRRPWLCGALIRLLGARPAIGRALAAHVHGVEAEA